MAVMEAAPRWQPSDRAVQALSGLARGSGWLLLAAGLAARQRPRAKLAVSSVILGFGASLLLELGSKLLIHRRRPDKDHGDHDAGPKDMERHSFPSGHAVGAFACGAAMATCYPRSAPLALGVAAAMASARVYLRRHNPSDVVGGAILGLGLGLGIPQLIRRWRPSWANE